MEPDRADPGPPEFAPRRVTERSWRRPAAAVVAFAAVLVFVGVVTKGPQPGSRSAVVSPVAQDRRTSAAPASARPVPADVACHELVPRSCLEIIQAALASLPADVPAASGASAWASLLCNSSIDCPPADLADGTPRGSVVVSFTDGGPAAWVNVVDHPQVGNPGPVTKTWIVRWQDLPPPTSTPSGSPNSTATAPDRHVSVLVVR